MNIYALKGHIVKLTYMSVLNGSKQDRELVMKFLQIGRGYQIEETDVQEYRTNVYLLGYPNIAFNSVSFVDLKPQTLHDDSLHPDYGRYNHE